MQTDRSDRSLAWKEIWVNAEGLEIKNDEKIPFLEIRRIANKPSS
jgi:hypothetical protein